MKPGDLVICPRHPHWRRKSVLSAITPYTASSRLSDIQAGCSFSVDEPMLVVAVRSMIDNQVWCLVLNHCGLGWLDEKALVRV